MNERMWALRRSRIDEEFTVFVKDVEPRLSYALAAAFGVEAGREATADALAYAWEYWDKIKVMDNAAGYLYRVGQSNARRYRRRKVTFPSVEQDALPLIEPTLPDALSSLSTAQRTAVVLLFVLEWSEREAADLLGVHRSTVRRHCDRGLAKLRATLGVTADA